MSFLHRLERLGPDLVLNREDAEDVPVDDDVQDGAAVRGPRLALFDQLRGGLEPELLEQARAADHDLAAIDQRTGTAAGERLEVGRSGDLDLAGDSALDEGSGERVF